MFTLKAPATFKVSVNLSAPGDGPVEPIRIEFRHKSQTQLKDFVALAASGEQEVDLLDAIIVGWALVADGDEVAYSKDNLRILLDQYSPAGTEIYRAYLKALNESRVKN